MSVAETVTTGSLLLAAPIAFAAGVVSFLSPCVLPLVPGYLSFITGLTGAEIAGQDPKAVPTTTTGLAEGGTAVKTVSTETLVRTKGRVLLGSLLFVLGFTFVFVAYGALFGALGQALV